MDIAGANVQKVIFSFFIALAIIGFPAHAVAEQSSLEVTDVWIPALPPSAPTAVVYMVIKNNSEKDDALISIKSSVAGKVAIHLMSMDDGMMSMRPVEKVTIPAHGSVKLHSGGLHIMMSKLKKPLKVGGGVDLTLKFEHAGEINLLAPVRE